jgi:hypothetical protein
VDTNNLYSRFVFSPHHVLLKPEAVVVFRDSRKCSMLSHQKRTVNLKPEVRSFRIIHSLCHLFTTSSPVVLLLLCIPRFPKCSDAPGRRKRV